MNIWLFLIQNSKPLNDLPGKIFAVQR